MIRTVIPIVRTATALPSRSALSAPPAQARKIASRWQDRKRPKSTDASTSFPNGYCTLECDPEYPCPEGLACIVDDFCARPCDSNGACADPGMIVCGKGDRSGTILINAFEADTGVLIGPNGLVDTSEIRL